MYLKFTIYAVAVWAIMLIARAILSFFHTHRQWRAYKANPEAYNGSSMRRTRVAGNKLGAASSHALPLFEIFRPLIAVVYRMCWLVTEPVMRIVRKFPTKMSITWIKRDEAKRLPFRLRMKHTETVVRDGYVIDIGPGLVLLAIFGLIRPTLENQYWTSGTLWLANTIWIVFAICVALFIRQLNKLSADSEATSAVGATG